ncbi:regulator of chromosome condensation repeat-containing protein [Cystoisospora suis]|uniref:Regulator of chromosome condensation repeat-containing protein n=1 Tax=Cystoisospora suis TaxID=483139 RepID=A0A2C6KKG0_9APIC|nr:regulator of chromosome condensation repeat-containing protein [Cystoisospora suis]
MNRLVEVDPQDKGILVSKSELIVVNGGACDFYTISLAERVETPVVISIRATYGEVAVCPDTLQIKPEEYNKLRRIVVVGGKPREASDATEEDSSRTELLHYVTSKSSVYDGFAFRLAVSLVSTSGSFLRSFGSNLHYQLAHDTTNKKCQTNPHKVRAQRTSKADSLVAKPVSHKADTCADERNQQLGGGATVSLSVCLCSHPGHFIEMHEQKASVGAAHEVGCGEAHTLVLTLQGSIYAFGDSRGATRVRSSPENGRLGIGPAPASLAPCPSIEREVGVLPSQHGGGQLYASYSTPQLLTGIPKVRKISVGGAFSACIGPREKRPVFVTSDGGAACSCSKTSEKINGVHSRVGEPRCLLQASCGKNHMVILTYEGDVFATGQGEDGRLGLGDTHSRHLFERIKTLPPVRFVCAGGAHSAALDSNLRVWTWGSNCCGQLGLSNWQPSNAFLIASSAAKTAAAAAISSADAGGSPEEIAALAAAAAATALRGALDGDRALLEEIRSKRHDLSRRTEEKIKRVRGDGSREGILTAYSCPDGYESMCVKPQIVEFLRDKKVVTLALGSLYSLAVTIRGFVYAWGSHEQGQLGLPDRLDNQPMPVLVPSFLFSPAVQVFASPCSNCSFVSSAAEVLNPHISVSLSNSPVSACSPTPAVTPSRSWSPTAGSSGLPDARSETGGSATSLRPTPADGSELLSNKASSMSLVSPGAVGQPIPSEDGGPPFSKGGPGRGPQTGVEAKADSPERKSGHRLLKSTCRRARQDTNEDASPRWHKGRNGEKVTFPRPSERARDNSTVAKELESDSSTRYRSENISGRHGSSRSPTKSPDPGTAASSHPLQPGSPKQHSRAERPAGGTATPTSPQAKWYTLDRRSVFNSGHSRRSCDGCSKDAYMCGSPGSDALDNCQPNDEDRRRLLPEWKGEEGTPDSEGGQAATGKSSRQDDDAAAAALRIAEQRRVGHASCTGGSFGPKNIATS